MVKPVQRLVSQPRLLDRRRLRVLHSRVLHSRAQRSRAQRPLLQGLQLRRLVLLAQHRSQARLQRPHPLDRRQKQLRLRPDRRQRPQLLHRTALREPPIPRQRPEQLLQMAAPAQRLELPLHLAARLQLRLRETPTRHLHLAPRTWGLEEKACFGRPFCLLTLRRITGSAVR